jgi:hypothetical protein
MQLLDELKTYPGDGTGRRTAAPRADLAGVVVPLLLDTGAGPLSLLSTTTVFGTPLDITLSELALECFYPADAATARVLHGLAERQD